MTTQKNTDDRIALLQGTLDLLILKTLVLGPCHGQGVARSIQRQSEEVFFVDHGSLIEVVGIARNVEFHIYAGAESQPLLHIPYAQHFQGNTMMVFPIRSDLEVLGLPALSASSLPARRAMSLEPMVALRED